MFIEILFRGVLAFFILHSEVKFFISYLLRWCYVTLDNFLHVSWFICCQERGILNPSISPLELSWYRFHLKPSLRNVILWCLSMIRVFSYPLGESSFHLFVDLKQAMVSISGRLSPHNFEMFSISPLQAYSFCCGFFPTTPLWPSWKGAFQDHLWQKLAFSSPFLYSNDLSSIFSFGGMVMLLSSLIISICEDHVLFMLIHLTGVLCLSFLF